MEFLGADWRVEDIAAYLVGEIEHHRHSYRVGDPHQGDRKGQVAAQYQGQNGSQHHLERHGDKADKNADKKCQGRGAPVQMPEIGI